MEAIIGIGVVGFSFYSWLWALDKAGDKKKKKQR